MHLENLHPRDNPVRLLSRRSFLARSVAAASPFLFASSTHAKETTMITDNEAVAVMIFAGALPPRASPTRNPSPTFRRA